MTQQSSLLVVLAVLALAASTSAHAILLSPTARAGANGSDNIGIKIPQPKDAQFFGTCGNAATTPGKSAATFAAGDLVPVKWKITIDHLSDPGVSVALRCGSNKAFTPLAKSIKAQLQQTTVTIPKDTPAGNCELQWIWSSVDDGGSYIACSDITVRAAAVVDAPSSSSSGSSSGSSSSSSGSSVSPVAASAPTVATPTGQQGAASVKTPDASSKGNGSPAQSSVSAAAPLMAAAVIVALMA
ncbi:hypothetical protein BC828DRAFT_376866 [Blastocladiella britannica]|nr:hypothetical protein BC828DRAFT_376866 [Blastocladiella britannica]